MWNGERALRREPRTHRYKVYVSARFTNRVLGGLGAFEPACRFIIISRNQILTLLYGQEGCLYIKQCR